MVPALGHRPEEVPQLLADDSSILLVTWEDIPKGSQGSQGKEVDAAVDEAANKHAGSLHIVWDLVPRISVDSPHCGRSGGIVSQ